MSSKYFKSFGFSKTHENQPEDLQSLFDFTATDLGAAGKKIPREILEKMGANALRSRLVDGEEKKFFQSLQDHIRGRIEKIIGVSKGFWKDELLSVDIRGSLTIGINPRGAAGVDPDTDCFVEEFTPYINDGVDRETTAKLLLDFWLVNLIRDLGLQPSRFSRCDRCGKFFYQATSRKRNYCSKQCAGAVRQARYERRKRQEKGGDKERKG